jgi:hypothetical protein
MKFILAVLLFIFISTSSFGQESLASLPRDDCGVNNGEIIAGDGTLCERDIAFGMLNEMFPSIFKEIIPLWNLSRFAALGDQPTKPELLGEYRGDAVFFALFDLFFQLILICIGLYVFLFALSTIGRLIKGESLSDSTSGKDTPGSVVAGALIGGSFLIPFKNFFLGQLIVFSLAIASLSMANFIFSLFLSGNQAIFENASDPERAAMMRNPNTQERHDFYADTYYRQLTRMQLCRMRTGEYIMSGASALFDDAASYKKGMQCAAPKSGTAANTWAFDNQPPQFMMIKSSLSSSSHGGDAIYGNLSKIKFGSDSSESAYCEFKGNEALPNYSCGELNVNMPDWGANPLIRVLNNPDTLNTHLAKLNALSTTTPPAAALNIVRAGWLGLKKDLVRALEAAWAEQDVDGLNDGTLVNVNNEVVRRSDSVREILMNNAEANFNQASMYYHQTAMNVLMFGQVFMYQGLFPASNVNTTYGTRNFENLQSHFERAGELGILLNKAQCSEFRVGLDRTEMSRSFLNGESFNKPSVLQARCLNFDNNVVMEYDPLARTRPVDELMATATARYEELQGEFSSKWADAVTNLASQRRSIEASYSQSVNEDSGTKWWIDLRQKGFLAAADYAQSVSRTVEEYKRGLRRVVNNYSFTESSYDDKYISLSVSGKYSVDDLFNSFSYAGNPIFNSTRLPKGPVDSFVGNGAWVAEQESVLRERALGVDTTDIFESLSNFVTMPQTYLDRLGISLNSDSKNEELCLEDPRGCPFPLSDPIIELSLMGHDMVDLSAQFFVMGIALKAITGPAVNNLLRNREGGSVTDSLSLKNKFADFSFGGLQGLIKTASILEFVYNLLSKPMMAFLLIGAGLAYLLPLVPKIYLYMNFISWTMVLVMSSFAVLLWSLFWVRFREKREILKTAGYHYGIELLFKPSFSLIAVLFAWYFFYVVAFGVGITTSWIWALPIYDSYSPLRLLIDTVIVIMMMMFIYFLGLHYAYQLMDNLVTELMKRLGVRNIKDNDKIGEFVKAIMFDYASRAAGYFDDKINKGFGRQKTKRDMMQQLGQARNKISAYEGGYQKGTRDAKNSPKEGAPS